MGETKVFDVFDPQADNRVEPDSTPRTRRKSLLFILLSLYW